MDNVEHIEKKFSGSKFFSADTLVKLERADKGVRRRVILVMKPRKGIKLRYNNKYKPTKHRKNFLKRYGISEVYKSKVKDFVSKYDLEIHKIVDEIGMIYISGTIENLEDAFKVELHQFSLRKDYKRWGHRLKEWTQHIVGHEGNFHLPIELESIVTGVIGLNQIPLVPFSPVCEDLDKEKFFSAAKGLNPSWYTEHYKFPKKYKGKGQKIAIISCGGGIEKSNIKYYFNALGIKDYPKIKYVSVDGFKNSPGSNFIGDFELATDCLVAMRSAPHVGIEVYSIDNSIIAFGDAIMKIAEGGPSAPKIISYSWGTGESNYSKLEIKGINRILKYATIVSGVTVLCATGDAGSTNNYETKPNSPLEVQFPASSPWVTSCGGTKISRDDDGVVVSEEAWNSPGNLYDLAIQNATGGGFSFLNARPKYQRRLLKNEPNEYPIKGRGLPDISAHADMSPGGIGYWISVSGKSWIGGGTSAVAPLIAGLVARINEACKRPLGFLNPLLYEMANSGAIQSINQGNNSMRNGPGEWTAREGWDPCTGLGIPNGDLMLDHVKKKLKV